MEKKWPTIGEWFFILVWVFLQKKVEINSLRNACIFSLIKLFCILKGIENRFHQGNAISKDAEEKILSAPAIKEVLMNSFETNPNDIIIS